MSENRFNLLYEKWIPVEGGRKSSLLEVFSPDHKGLIGGNAIQKISLYKLLFCIAQDAVSLGNREEWEEMEISGFSQMCIDYLNKYRDCFWLYGEKPFLQYPELESKDMKDNPILISYIPDIAAENDTIIRETQTCPPKDDAERALFVLSLVSYALGGKRVAAPDKFRSQADERGKSAKSSPGLGSGNIAGYQHSFIICKSILETVYNNYFTDDEIKDTKCLKDSTLPPWRQMPSLEISSYNDLYRSSVWAWFISLSRAVLLTSDGIKYGENLVYTGKWFEPFISINQEDRVLIVDTTKKPWRNLPALLVESNVSQASGYRCFAISSHLKRARESVNEFSIWSGGLRVRGNSGDQSIKQNDDFVESSMNFESCILGERFYGNLRNIIEYADTIESDLRKAISRYYWKLGFEKNKMELTKSASIEFWNEMDRISQEFADSADSEEQMNVVKNKIFRISRNIYDCECTKVTARQIMAWQKYRPFQNKEEKV